MLRVIAEELTKVGGGGRAFYCGAYTFAVVFRRTSAQAASRHLDAVRRAVEAATVDVRVPQRLPEGQPGRPGTVVRTVSVTISIGVAQPQGRRADPHEVLRAADLALDRAKQAGLNRVSA
jgi:GGDEF domain-containing protein